VERIVNEKEAVEKVMQIAEFLGIQRVLVLECAETQLDHRPTRRVLKNQNIFKMILLIDQYCIVYFIVNIMLIK